MENGFVPDDLLVEVEPGKFLERATAAAYLKAKRASVGLLKIASPAGAYRSYAVQKDMTLNPWRYGIDPDLAVGISAPGSSSHGFGTRVDLVIGPARVWADARLADFGFRKEFGDKDPGHWQFLRPTFASTDTAPIPILEDDMFTDADRAILIELRNHRPIREMKLTPDGTVWYCLERALRVAIRREDVRDRYQAHLRNLGYSDVIEPISATAIEGYGVPVFQDEIARIAAAVDGVIDDEKLLAAIGSISDGDGTDGPTVDAITDRLVEVLPPVILDALAARVAQ